jgi:hypothetical protein
MLYFTRETHQLFVLTTRAKHANTVCDQNEEDLGVKTVLTRNVVMQRNALQTSFLEYFWAILKLPHHLLDLVSLPANAAQGHLPNK